MINSIYSSEAARTATVNRLINQRKHGETSEVETVDQVDRVSISGEAYALLSGSGAEKTAQTDEVGGSNLQSVAEELLEHMTYMLNNLEEITEDYQAELKQKLRGRGIDVDTEIELTTGRDGSVKVKGDHPDKAEIEQYFKDNPEMRDRFWDIAVHTEIKQALELHTEFAEAYEQDPEAAVAKYFPRFAMLKMQGYTMSIGGEEEASSSQAA